MTGRRTFLLGLGACAGLPFVTPVLAQPHVDAAAFGLGADRDASAALQLAVDAAIALEQPLFIPAGTYRVRDVAIAAPLRIVGSGAAILAIAGGETIFSIHDCANVRLDGLAFDGTGGLAGENGLITITNVSGIALRDCSIEHAAGIGIGAHRTSGTIENCRLADIGDTGIFATDSTGLDILANTIARCGNGGVRIWRYSSGFDGSRIAGNRISDIDWRSGGNGQNGNGINVFRADGVSITDNVLVGCGFSAVRLNATHNSRIIGNHCERSGEIAIFSEFGFSGSIISDNLVDGAAGGISMTNFDREGRLSLCSGNIVRNIAPRSESNPDVTPYGIAAEADAVVTGNIVEEVPGIGISVGWGPYLRDVSVSDNLVRNCEIGILASVAPEAGAARIAGNVISGARQHALAAAQWDEIVSTDLVAESGRFANLSIGDNTIL